MNQDTRSQRISGVVIAIVSATVGGIAGGIVVGVLVPWYDQVMSEEPNIREIIDKEAKLVLEGKIDEVVLLFDENAVVRDAAGGNYALQITWHGRSEIAQRYRNLPRFDFLQHQAIEITLSSDRTYARATADTVGAFEHEGRQVQISSNRGERWTLEKLNNEWKIIGFTYNLP